MMGNVLKEPAAAPADRWEAALRRYHETTEAYSLAAGTHSRAEEGYFARKPERPDTTLEIEGDYGRFGKHVLPVWLSDEQLDDPTQRWRDPERVEQMRVALQSWREADAALRQEAGVDQTEAAEQAALDRQTDALNALLAEPAPDMAALAKKLRVIVAEYGDEGDGALATVIADVQRLAGEA